MDPITMAALASAGFKILGGIGGGKDAKINNQLQTLANDVNTNASKLEVTSNYSDIFEEQASRMGTQKAYMADLDKAGTAYQGTLTEHERAFLKTANNQEKDLRALDRKGAMNKTNINMNTQNAINQSNLSMMSGLTDAFIFSKYGGTK